MGKRGASAKIQAISGSIQRISLSFAGQPVAVQVSGDPDPADNGLFHIYADHLGSTGSLSDSSGVYIPDSHAKYTPFGDWRTEPTATASDRYYTGHKHNNLGGGADDLGLIYMNARYYLPNTNRMVSPDTIVPDPTNPQSYNRYSYANNNPIRYRDPTGHAACQTVELGCAPATSEKKYFRRGERYSQDAIERAAWYEPPAKRKVGLTQVSSPKPEFPIAAPWTKSQGETISTITDALGTQVSGFKEAISISGVGSKAIGELVEKLPHPLAQLGGAAVSALGPIALDQFEDPFDYATLTFDVVGDIFTGDTSWYSQVDPVTKKSGYTVVIGQDTSLSAALIVADRLSVHPASDTIINTVELGYGVGKLGSVMPNRFETRFSTSRQNPYFEAFWYDD